MFGSSAKFEGAVSRPATAPERRREAPAERQHPGHADAHEPSLLRVDRRSPEGEAELREAEERPEQRHDAEGDADRPDLVRGDDDAADVVRAGPERPFEQLWHAAPLPDDEAVDGDEQADGHDDDPEHAPPLHRPDHDPVDEHAADERHHERRRRRGPVAPAVVHDERPRDVRGERRHLALREVDDPGRAVDDHEREREQGEDPTGGEARDDVLHELGEGRGEHQYPR